MDQSIRNKLRNVVTQCRKLLEEAVSQVLQGQFGIYGSGKKDEVHVEDEGRMKNLSEEDKGYRRDIIAHLGHIQALGYKAKDALAQLVREIAFTHLNRLSAYKMMEAREVWVCGQRFREAVSRGMKSQGFQFYLADHADDKKLFDAGHQDVAYRHFLGWLGALLSEEIGVLFSPTDPANRLFPPQRVLDDVLALLNSEDLKDIWAKDETIGWVYQYFTPKELRDQVRKESAAPRNSYELAFRNQFFTPRYVVEFLTDNTLGRIWYEMRKGDTKLKDQCCYLVRRPSEVFLAEGQSPPEPMRNQDELSQEELLRQPVHIPHRLKKDPRELRILDPACGSGHFLLYCFDLLLTIYEEAYADPDLGPKLKEGYPTLDALRRDVPRLILTHNLHGIDIDLRASQIAALALWLRCQREYRQMGLKQDRPKITKSNIVCAEPMPGEKTLLDEFLKTLKQDRLENLIRRVMQVPEGSRVRATESMAESLTELVRLVWDKMQLAGEAGSLLKIEEELQEAVRKGQDEWEEKQPLFRFTEFSLTEQPKESYVRIVPGEGVSFWQRAEALVLEALREYARHAANGGRLQRQLFADDAERGFAFIDVCQKRYDAVLMNPPFGEVSIPSRKTLYKSIPIASQDIFAAFIARCITVLEPLGRRGAITNRLGLFKDLLDQWREAHILGQVSYLTELADLGYGVLDEAVVEAAAYVLQKGSLETRQLKTLFISALDRPDKAESVTDSLSRVVTADSTERVFQHELRVFTTLPKNRISYWCSQAWLDKFASLPKATSVGVIAKKGLETGRDFELLRLWWEVPADSLKSFQRWTPYSKGGAYRPWHNDLHLVFDWSNEEAARRTSNSELYGKAGLTYTERTTSNFAARLLPAGAVFSPKGPGIFDTESGEPWGLLGFLNSSVVAFFLELLVGGGDSSAAGTAARDFSPTFLETLPVPQNCREVLTEIAPLVKDIHDLLLPFRVDETSWQYGGPFSIATTLQEAASSQFTDYERVVLDCIATFHGIDEIVKASYGLSENERRDIRHSSITRWKSVFTKIGFDALL